MIFNKQGSTVKKYKFYFEGTEKKSSQKVHIFHCVKGACIRSFSGLDFPAF